MVAGPSSCQGCWCPGSRAGTAAALALLPEHAPLAARGVCWLLGSTLQHSARSGPRVWSPVQGFLLPQKGEVTNVKIFLEVTQANVHPLLSLVQSSQETPVLVETTFYLLLFCYYYFCKIILCCVSHSCFTIMQIQKSVPLVLGLAFLDYPARSCRKCGLRCPTLLLKVSI